ncbi:hypothetical protein Dimus_022387 [Dionaea muscipula]
MRVQLSPLPIYSLCFFFFSSLPWQTKHIPESIFSFSTVPFLFPLRPPFRSPDIYLVLWRYFLLLLPFTLFVSEDQVGSENPTYRKPSLLLPFSLLRPPITKFIQPVDLQFLLQLNSKRWKMTATIGLRGVITRCPV